MNKPNGRVLLTGATGLVATHIAELFDKADDLILTSRSQVNDNRHVFIDFDWKHTNRIVDFLNDIRPQVIIHTAGVTSVDYAELNKDETDVVNVQAVEEIAMWCNLNECRLIHFSTDFVFDGESGMYTEDDLALPLSHYGKSKLRSEEIVTNKCANSAVIRTVLVYGYSRSLSRLNFPIWLKQQLENRNKLNITADQFRTPTYAVDLANAVLGLASSNATGLFHVSGPEYVSVFDFALKVCNELELDETLISASKTDQMNQAGRRPLKTGFNIEKIKSLIDYEPLNIDAGLRQMHQRMISA